MIISDTHQIIFIHIPKCAGTSVRSALSGIDDGGYGSPKGVQHHPQLGQIDYNHIPLFLLRKHFADVYRKLDSYNSYAVVRDPYARFRSSMFHRFREYESDSIHRLSAAEVQRETERVMEFLWSRGGPRECLPYDYVHFQRQSDFVFDQGKRLVKNIYTTDDVNSLLSEIASHLGGNGGNAEPGDLLPQRKNVTREYRSEVVRGFARLVHTLGYSQIRPLIPRRVRAAVGNALTVSSNKRLDDVFESHEVRDFVSSYYRDDIDLVYAITGCGR